MLFSAPTAWARLSRVSNPGQCIAREVMSGRGPGSPVYRVFDVFGLWIGQPFTRWRTPNGHGRTGTDPDGPRRTGAIRWRYGRGPSRPRPVLCGRESRGRSRPGSDQDRTLYGPGIEPRRPNAWTPHTMWAGGFRATRVGRVAP